MPIVFVGLLAVLAFAGNKFLLVPKQCRAVMQNGIMWCIFEYKKSHEGRAPRDLIDLALHYRDEWTTNNDRVSFLSCPGVKEGGLDTATLKETSDYIYINWEPMFGTNEPPSGYPVIYDRRLSNHGGLGINVFATGGPPFWDWRGHWLKKFAAEHPDTHLIMPEGIQ